jgi:hypothetical protein
LPAFNASVFSERGGPMSGALSFPGTPQAKRRIGFRNPIS